MCIRDRSTESRRVYEVMEMVEGKNVLDLMRKVDQMRLEGQLKDYDISKKSLEDIFISLIRKTRISRNNESHISGQDFLLDSEFDLKDSSKLKMDLKAATVYQKLRNIEYIDTMANIPFTREVSRKSISEDLKNEKKANSDLSKTLIEDNENS